MYPDVAVIIASSKTTQETAHILRTELTNIHEWLKKSCLLSNIKKTVCMYFSETTTNLTHSGVFLGGEELELVNQFKYKFNLANFKSIRSSLTTVAGKLFLHAMIRSHIEYGFTSWSFTAKTTLSQVESHYKRVVKL